MRLVYAIVLIAILTIGYVWLYAGYQIGSDYDRDVKTIQFSQTIMVRDFTQRVVRAIDERDRFLKLLRDDYQSADGKIDLQRYSKIFGSLYTQLNVVDPSGRLIASTRQINAVNPDWSANDLYIAHRDHLDDSLQLSRPRRLPGSDQWLLHMARRIFSAKGDFAGMIEMEFAVDRLPALYANVDSMRADERLTVDSNGIATESQPLSERMILRRIDESVMGMDDSELNRNQLFGAQSPGAQKFSDEPYSWVSRKLEPYPLLLSVKLPDPDPLPAQESPKLMGYIMYASVPTLLILLLISLAYRIIKRQYQVVHRYNSLRRRATDANKRKSRFLATVVHELRTPLSGVHGYSELVRDTSSDPQSREFGDLIHQSAIYLHGLLNTLFDLARIEAGRVVIFHENIDTLAYFEYVGSMHKINADKKGLSFQMRLAPDLPANFLCDRVRLSQILNNMLDNAVKFTVTGGVAIEVTTAKEQLKIRVLDSGPGISKSELKHLFEYFYQSESVRAGRSRGLGLGLSLAKEFTDLIRGSIRIDSEVGVGTVVNLSIPLNVR
ncbi:Sensor histidine kinase/response regulator [Collimonas arenae]|uniref:histidine kinase n=1 Tax=Collimonas arenae TaxID=279058 RepID=A0A0A1F9I5_9BURK|nr:ATP-binding protein [Collimonas arenae]AIY40309.1 Sensor histidine kinase/response regulator [Collimonas arenae]